jgi:hypothetical protein
MTLTLCRRVTFPRNPVVVRLGVEQMSMPMVIAVDTMTSLLALGIVGGVCSAFASAGLGQPDEKGRAEGRGPRHSAS